MKTFVDQFQANKKALDSRVESRELAYYIAAYGVPMGENDVAAEISLGGDVAAIVVTMADLLTRIAEHENCSPIELVGLMLDAIAKEN